MTETKIDNEYEKAEKGLHKVIKKFVTEIDYEPQLPDIYLEMIGTVFANYLITKLKEEGVINNDKKIRNRKKR